MVSQPVHPLRIQKGTPVSPGKSGSGIPRPLSELTPSDKRRNSPSFNQTTKKMVLKEDSSPFQSSPFNASDTNSSPRLFWQGRDPATPTRFNSENGLFVQRSQSPSPTRRTSIEKLQKASRVKNSNMFAREQKQEYDPTNIPVIERPLAKQVQGNAYGGSGLTGLRNEEKSSPWSHKRSESKLDMSLYDPMKSPLSPKQNANDALHSRSPSKDRMSPTKSSLSQRLNFKSSFDPENGTWSEDMSDNGGDLDDIHPLRRHAKSVTFDNAPPQVNEYEMTTPDMSSIGTGSRDNSYDSGEDDEDDEDLEYERDVSEEHDDSFDASLEDTEKTPVVGPDDWRHASPETHHGLFDQFEDPFDGPEGSPVTEARPASADRPTSSRESSDHRPLPPLPPPQFHGELPARLCSPSGLSAAAERASSSQRGLPSPPKAATMTKDEIHNMIGGKMTLEERLHLMSIQNEKPKTAAEEQRERRMRRAIPSATKDIADSTSELETGDIQIHEDEDTLGDVGDYQLPPRISRESILRKVAGQDNIGRESDYNFSSPASSPERVTLPDPDVPLPSTEEPSILEADDDKENGVDSVKIKVEDEDDECSITEMYQRSESGVEDEFAAISQMGQLGQTLQQDLRLDDDAASESQYSNPTPTEQSPEADNVASAEEDGPPTPRQNSPILKAPSLEPEKQIDFLSKEVSLPEFTGFLKNDDFGLSLQSYMSPSPPPAEKKDRAISAASLAAPPKLTIDRPVTPLQQLKPSYDGSGWGPEEGEDEYDFGTPDSVIRHPVVPETPPSESPDVPEQVATIKGTSGSKLKTRPSATPSDLMAMREARRQISGEVHNIPAIPERHRNRPSLNLDRSQSEAGLHYLEEESPARKPSFKRSLTLDISAEIGKDSGLGLDKDFDRVIAAQKRGYLMRQNTKLVVASSDGDHSPGANRYNQSAGNSPVKDDLRPQSWVVEPWNSRKRTSMGSTKKKIAAGPVPPLPGQDSNATGMSSLNEEESAHAIENGERGRLFVKVIGVKDLDLPLPKSERSWFSLTLDNGVHCVTTAWLELGKNAPIGQEFELVVPNDLEFQLTLNAKLEKPAPKRMVETPVRIASPKKPSTFSRVFTSPKKRKELEMRQQEDDRRIADQRSRDAQAERRSAQPTTWDLLSPLAAEDGSFGRSYVCLKDHESRCYGRPYVVDIACFNEWATEDAHAASSVKSKRGNTNVIRRAPYKVGKLELQLLFVPKPKGAKDEDMPKSMNGCIRQMKEAEAALARSFEGHLSQQGGDCPYWRRRFFRIAGTKLTAYHESTGQPRATINLSNASKLIDDRRALTQKETTGRGGSRRKSGFAEEEEGYMFVEEGFRVRFNNGEVIDFYADSPADKESWMKVLDQCIGKAGTDGKSDGGKWCEFVLRREESMMRKRNGQSSRKASAAGGRGHSRTKSSIV